MDGIKTTKIFPFQCVAGHITWHKLKVRTKQWIRACWLPLCLSLFYDLYAGGLELFFVGTNFLVPPPKSSHSDVLQFFIFKVLCFMILKVLWLVWAQSQGWLCEDEQQANVVFYSFPWAVTECSWLKLKFTSNKVCLCFIVPCFKIKNSLTNHRDGSSTSSIYFLSCFYFGVVYSYSLHYYARILYKIYPAKKPNLMSF